MTSVADSLAQSLEDVGVRFVFGVPSGGWIDYMEAIRETEGLEFVLVGHEGAGSFMAAVCGTITGRPGACFGTFGPGATNLSTGVGCAYLDRAPMLAFTDEFEDSMRGRKVQMNIDHQALFQPITKQTTRLEADSVFEIVHSAASLATAEVPGPVHIGLPVGMASQPSVPGHRQRYQPQRVRSPEEEALERMEELFARARKPLLVVGLTATRFDVSDLLIRLTAKHEVPVILTPMAKGTFPEKNACYGGVLFHALSDLVAETHRQADLIVGVGYDPVEFNYESWLPDAPLVHIDTTEADVDRAAFEVACDVVGDLKPALQRLLELDAGAKDWDLQALAMRRRNMVEKFLPDSDSFGPTAALRILREALPDDGVLTCDVGAHTHLIGQQWQTPAEGKLLMTNGWSSMGYGIPAAMAAKLCLPDRAVCAVVGDGGFLMMAGEMETAARLGLAVVFVVLTDRCLSLIRIKQQRKDHAVYGTPIRTGGYTLGDSFLGVPVYPATSSNEYRKALEAALSTPGPAIVEAFIDGAEYDDLVLKANR